MDEIDVLRANRPEPRPSAEVVAGHRAELRRAIDRPAEVPGVDHPRETGPVISLDRPAPTRAHRTVLATAAAAAVVVLAMVGAAIGFSGEKEPSGFRSGAPTSATPTTASEASRGAPSCGGSLPVQLPRLPGFSEQTPGVGGDAFAAPAPEQLTAHWASATGSIEARWPADRARTAMSSSGGGDPASGVSVIVGGEPRSVPSGRHAVSIDVIDESLSDATPCHSLQLVVADDDPQRAREVGSELLSRLTEPGGAFGGPATALVVGAVTAEAPPEIPACDAPPGVEHDDRVGGPVDLGTHATPENALVAFIESKQAPDIDGFGLPTSISTVVDRGYTAMDLPDGTIAFVATYEAGVTVVRVVPAGSGWTVDRWDATGC